jgi:PAS domain S-box-containing protein
VLLTTLDGRILAGDATACAMFGHSAETIVRIGVGRLAVPGEQRLRTLLEEVTRAGHSTGAVRLIRKDGTTFRGNVACAIFFDQAGNERISLIVRA